ncbi:hypothetical protein F2Q68_00042285 [Brassica cretica]|uniref:Secreted protein n=1 Tax=Brassica cretica TaxID=69181 RepID=A0A8S9MBP4_BRACR|nr:hypothetical protein F2Q68_00042285 [Brassica cretica]
MRSLACRLGLSYVVIRFSLVFDCLDLGFIVVTKLGCMQDDLDYHVEVTDSRLRALICSLCVLFVNTESAEEPCCHEQEYEKRLFLNVNALVNAWDRWSCCCNMAAS